MASSYLGALLPDMNYMTYDNNNNVYNYKNLNEKQQIYQRYQDMCFNTHFKPPLTDNSVLNRDPTNLPCDIRPSYLTLNYNSGYNYQLNYDNNPNFYNLKQGPKPGYYKQYGDGNNNINNARPKSFLDKAFETSKQDYHGFIIEK